MKKEIFKLAELNKKIAFIKGNRAIATKNLSQKIASVKNYGQLVPLVIVRGEDVAKDNLEMIDAVTNAPISPTQASEYVAIIEGQHRFTALYKLLGEDMLKETWVMYPINEKGHSVNQLIAEMNRVSCVWEGGDYITGAAMSYPNHEGLQYAKELADMKPQYVGERLPKSGYPISTISKLLTFSSALDKDKLAECIANGIDVLPTFDVERAKAILAAARKAGFSEIFLARRYYIDWVRDEANKRNLNEILSIVERLDSETVKSISKVTGKDSTAQIRALIYPK